jgi:hypothetical protein
VANDRAKRWGGLARLGAKNARSQKREDLPEDGAPAGRSKPEPGTPYTNCQKCGRGLGTKELRYCNRCESEGQWWGREIGHGEGSSVFSRGTYDKIRKRKS